MGEIGVESDCCSYEGGLEWWRCHSSCMAFLLAIRDMNRSDMVMVVRYRV
jgi:hypothetical protein